MAVHDNYLIISGDKASFDPLDVLQSHSTKIERLPSHIELIQDHFDPDEQARLEYRSYNVFVSKTELGTFVFAVIVYRDSNVTKNTRLNVELRIKWKIETKTETDVRTEWQGYELLDAFGNVPNVNVVKCQFEDGSLALLGMLCIPVELCWKTSYHNPLQNLDQEFKVGVAIRNTHEPDQDESLRQDIDNGQLRDSWQTEAEKDLSH